MLNCEISFIWRVQNLVFFNQHDDWFKNLKTLRKADNKMNIPKSEKCLPKLYNVENSKTREQTV